MYLIMTKNRKNKKDNSGDALFGRLGRTSSNGRSAHGDELPVSDSRSADGYDSIDITEESDSELDINELLRKYMPEYSNDGGSSGDGGSSEEKGVLSRLKQTKVEQTEDDKLISALDSVFSQNFEEESSSENSSSKQSDGQTLEEHPVAESTGDEDELLIEEEIIPEETDGAPEFDTSDESFEKAVPDNTGRRGLFGRKNQTESPVDEYELDESEEPMYEDEADSDDDLYEEDTLPSPEWMEEEPVKKPKKKLFGFGFRKKNKKIPAPTLDDFPHARTLDDAQDDESIELDVSPSEPVTGYSEEYNAYGTENGEVYEPDTNKVDDVEEVIESVGKILNGVSDEATAASEISEEVDDVPAEETENENGEAIVETELEDEKPEEESDVTELRLDLSEEVSEAEKTDVSADVSQDGASGGDEESDFEGDFEDEPIDPTDMNLMIAFGLDGKGDKKADRAKALGDRLEARQHTREANKVKLDRPEFVDKTQIPRIRKELKRRGAILWLKLILCAVFTVMLMVFENMETLSKLFTGTSKQFGGAFDPAVYPTVYIMVSLQLMLLACLCAYEQIIDGFKYLFRGVPKPETMLSIMTFAGILYSVLLVRLNDGEPVMFNFMVALAAFYTLIYAIYNHRREALNFRIVGNKKPKHIMRRLDDEESEGEARAFEDNDEVCDVMKIEKTDFIDGFFGRLARPDPTTTRFMAALLSVVGAVAVLFGVLANFRGGNASAVLGTVYASLLIVAPLSIYITFSYPFYRANIAAREYDSAIIGDSSLEEYSNASIISFDDKNVFPSYSVKVQNIRIYNNARVDRVFYYAASVFAYAGGPLQDVFEVATLEMGHSANVKIYDTEAGFLATQVNGVNIFFGNAETLKERGFEIDAGAEEDDMDLSDELSVMYMFRENKLVAKMYIQYVMDADIDLILKQFSGSGLYICVRTFDPNIDERMIARKLNVKRMPLKIVRYASAEEVTSYEEKVDSGLVTCGSPKSLLQVISYCEKVLRTRKTNIALAVLSVMIGAAILVLLLLSDSMGLLNSLYIAIYQLIWMIPLSVSSRMFIR